MDARDSVFDLLDEIRARPSMFLRNSSLEDLQTLLFGYYAALDVHGLVEPVPKMDRHFLFWMEYRTGWSLCTGWAVALTSRYGTSERALEEFFNFADEFRRLRSVTLCSVRLQSRHRPTGNRVTIGFGERIRKPKKVDILRYRPLPLHFLRFHYSDGIQDQDLLFVHGGVKSSLRDAKVWVRDELQVAVSEWMPAGRPG